MCRYITPTTEYSKLYERFLLDAHGMVAGASGSGKSTAINGILHALCCHAPCDMSYAIIDIKQVSLLDWEYLPHCMRYARTVTDAHELIYQFSATMDDRYAKMLEQRTDKYNGTHLYLIIDEAADLLDSNKEIINELIHICRLGRACNIHVIYATQSPDRKTIPSQLQQNIPCVLGLRCRSHLESRQIINAKGCETLTGVGHGYLVSSKNPTPSRVTVPYISHDDIEQIKSWWADESHIQK